MPIPGPLEGTGGSSSRVVDRSIVVDMVSLFSTACPMIHCAILGKQSGEIFAHFFPSVIFRWVLVRCGFLLADLSAALLHCCYVRRARHVETQGEGREGRAVILKRLQVRAAVVSSPTVLHNDRQCDVYSNYKLRTQQTVI